MKPARRTLLLGAEAATARCRDAHALACCDRERGLPAHVPRAVRVLAARARSAAREPERRADAPLRQDRDLHRLEELELADQPVPAGPPAAPARARTQRELHHAHGEAALQ